MNTPVYFVCGFYVLADDNWPASLLDILSSFSLTVAEKYQGCSFRKTVLAVRWIWYQNAMLAPNAAWYRENSSWASDLWDLRACHSWGLGKYSEGRKKIKWVGSEALSPHSARAYLFYPCYRFIFHVRVSILKEGKIRLTTPDFITFYMRKETQRC